MPFELIHVGIALVALVGGGAAGLAAGVWRVAHIEQKVRDDFKQCIEETRQEIEEKVESLVSQFQETFSGLRQKINDVELQTERMFMSKDGFNDFRKEYRDDMAKLMEKIDHISARSSRGHT